MNICIITPRYPYKDNMEFVFVKNLVDEWARIGSRCVVITDFSLTTWVRGRIVYKPRHYQYTTSTGARVDVYNPRCITTKLKLRGIDLDSWVSASIIARQLKRLRIKFDFIYCHFFISGLKVFHYAANNNVPCFVATGESTIGPLLKPFPSFKWNSFRSYVSGVIAVSSNNKKVAEENGYIDAEKCQVFPNGTNTLLFRPLDKRACRERLGLPQDAFIVSCVGYFCERKGQNRLLEAIRLLQNESIRVLFMGRATIENLALDGDEILFKGSVKNTDLPTFLCASDVFCLPTQAEGCCNAIIEALACGLPIVSSNLPFNLDVLNSTNSILVNPNNIEEISNAINALYNDKGLILDLSKGALVTSSALSIGERASRIMDFIESRL